MIAQTSSAMRCSKRALGIKAMWYRVHRPSPLSSLLRHNSTITTESSDHVSKSMYAKPPLPETPLVGTVFQECSKWSHKTAFECGITGRNYTHGELQDAARRWGGFIHRAWGEGTMNTVGILSPNTPEYPIIILGTIAAGCTATTISAAYTPAEVANHLSDSGAEVLVVEGIMEPLADAALKILKKDIPVVVNGSSSKGRPNLQEIIKDNNIPFADDKPYDPNHIAILPYSSGTTGKPKGVSISQRAINAGVRVVQIPEFMSAKKAEGDHQEVLLGLVPFYHLYGTLAIIFTGLARGAKVVTLPNFDPTTFVNAVKTKKITYMHTAPPIIQFMAKSPAVVSKDLSHMHTLFVTAAPMSPVLAKALKEKTGDQIFFQEGFAMTEALCTHLTPIEGEKLGSCGRLLPHVSAKVVDLDKGTTLPTGAKGELCVKSPALMTGYHNNPKATKETIDEEGWLHTGDVAIFDEDGYFSIVDRIKELIKVKGLQVSPSELEDVLLSHPGVADVGVIGIKDERSGEVPRAYIVPKQKDLSEVEIHAFLEGQLASYKKLAGGVRFLSELPKSATGKIQKKQLKEMAEKE